VIVVDDLSVCDDFVMLAIVEMALFLREKNVKRIAIVPDMVTDIHVNFVDVRLLEDEDEEILFVEIFL
jgi:hypothetical protein